MKKIPLSLIIGGVITGTLVGAAIVSQFWTPGDPTAMNITQRMKGPGVSGLLGTDQIGRDVFSIIMAGAFTSLGIAFLATLVGSTIGTIIGVAAAAVGGAFDRFVMAVNGVLFAFPPILSAILLGALLGGGPRTAIIAIGLFMVPVFARITRGAALQIWSRDFVQAARMAGKGPVLITAQHILPNISAQLIVQLAIQTGLGILSEAGLSYLGMSVAPPTPSWGRMLFESQTYISTAPHLVLAPGLAICIAVLGLNLLGDGLRDLTDPRRSQAS
ncbi:peptide ABC transporter permease protein [Ketogulonicigenium vulgare Y25]|uniref:Peptide ABC transporter permease protein n=1 Tax=Ketogulonicigenium vulgare (strain WSH-001) TaxID=759362 RepID=F9Y5M3_KETVW|nr:ABC transporter permease [Ketogulonicigenium vulgare]ADO42582.1 peptide ABC transporter permease protein [Ketogulonicigenium vulgare Y25]AEM40776.1 Peptide ABC transporter permease protein [Ketogulonicigenium vulgare WSH-001]ALJ80943.1 peptide ABC transporter permease [Ketogulonicigenium vulgare]AOZ54494.1 peptide ABC transporter permease [Ketogulonicigenium vulgare]